MAGSGDWNQQSQLGQAQYGVSRKCALAEALQIGQRGMRERLANPGPYPAGSTLDNEKRPGELPGRGVFASATLSVYGTQVMYTTTLVLPAVDVNFHPLGVPLVMTLPPESTG